MAGCGLPTALYAPSSAGKIAPGSSYYIVNPSTGPGREMGALRTFWFRWDPDVEMAVSEREIRKALEKRGRLAESLESAGAVLRLVRPRPESTDVSEELEAVDPGSGRVMAIVNRKADSWDSAIAVFLGWADGVPAREEDP